MHSSSMRTTRLLTVSGWGGEGGRSASRRGLHPGGLPNPPQVCLWGVCIREVCNQGGSAQPPRSACIQGGLPTLKSAYRGSASRGVCPTPNPPGLPTGGSASKELGRRPSPVNRMTHRCKTLPCPKPRLRAVK